MIGALKHLEAGRKNPRLGVSAVANCVGSKRRERESQKGLSGVSRGGADDSSQGAMDGPNQEWALDFVQDAAASGRTFRALSVVGSLRAGVPGCGRRTSREMGQI
jgi:hypothetical protein